jgi:hypothetical protein
MPILWIAQLISHWLGVLHQKHKDFGRPERLAIQSVAIRKIFAIRDPNRHTAIVSTKAVEGKHLVATASASS